MSRFDQPISGYVDYKFAEVGDGRRERYLDNFYTTEAIRTSAAQLEAAPFEGDKAYRQKLLSDTDNMLNTISQRGDYENMTVAVNRTASDYQVKTIPLAKNLERYTEYQENLKELYEDDKIDYEDFKGNMLLSTAMYGGLQSDESGRVNPDSMFTGLDPVTNPDINKMIREQLNGMVPYEIKSVGRRVGQGEGAMYEVESSEGLKYIDAARVEEAMESVMTDPRVQSYIGRKADIRTGLLNEEGLTKKFQADIEGISQELASVDAQLAAGTNAVDQGKLQSKKARLTSQLGMMQGVMGDPEAMRKLAAQSEVTSLNNMYRDSALAKYVYQQQDQSQKVFWDDVYKMKLKDSMEFNSAYPPITWEGEVISQDNFYGNTDLEAMEIRESKVAIYNDLVSNLEKFAGDDASPEEVEKYVAQVRNAFRDITRGDEYFKWRYGSTNPEMYDLEEYKVLDEKVDKAWQALRESFNSAGEFGQTYYGGGIGGSTYAIQGKYFAYNAAVDARNEFMKQNAKNDPVEQVNMQVKFASARMNPMFQGQNGQQVARAIDQAITQLFKAPPSSLPIYEPNTTELTTFRDASDPLSVDNKDYRIRINAADEEQTMIPADAKYASHGISLTPPNPFLGPMIAINYTSETRGTGTYHVPLNEALEIPALNAAFGTPHMQAIIEIGAFESIPDITSGGAEGGAMVRSIPVYSNRANKPATMYVRYAPAGPQAKIVPPGRSPDDVEYMDAYGPEFGSMMNNMEFTLN